MREPTNIQIIKDGLGRPAYAVIPFDEYEKMLHQHGINLEHAVPSEVVDLIFDQGYTPARAWREHLGKTQEEVAAAMGISQAAYSAHERSERLRKTTRAKIANALGITIEQLDF